MAKAVSGVYTSFAKNSGVKSAIKHLIATVDSLADFLTQLAPQFDGSVNGIDVKAVLEGFASVLHDTNTQMQASLDSAIKGAPFTFSGNVEDVKAKAEKIYGAFGTAGTALITGFTTGKGVTDSLNELAAALVDELSFIAELDQQITGSAGGIDVHNFIAHQTESGQAWLEGTRQNAAASKAFDEQ